MDASNSVIGKLQLTLGQSRPGATERDTLPFTRLVWGLVSCTVIFHPFTVNTRNLSSSILLLHWNELLKFSSTEFAIFSLPAKLKVFTVHAPNFAITCVFYFSQLNCFSVRLIFQVFHQFLVSGPNVGVLCHRRRHCPFTRVHKFTWSGVVNSSWWLLLTLSVGVNSHCVFWMRALILLSLAATHYRSSWYTMHRYKNVIFVKGWPRRSKQEHQNFILCP